MGDVTANTLEKKARILLQPISKVHLNNAFDDGLTHGDIRFIWLFAAVAGFILVIACINFINLSTAKSANRAREVGLRKVVGSLRSGLVRQFLTESCWERPSPPASSRVSIHPSIFPPSNRSTP